MEELEELYQVPCNQLTESPLTINNFLMEQLTKRERLRAGNLLIREFQKKNYWRKMIQQILFLI